MYFVQQILIENYVVYKQLKLRNHVVYDDSSFFFNS